MNEIIKQNIIKLVNLSFYAPNELSKCEMLAVALSMLIQLLEKEKPKIKENEKLVLTVYEYDENIRDYKKVLKRIDKIEDLINSLYILRSLLMHDYYYYVKINFLKYDGAKPELPFFVVQTITQIMTYFDYIEVPFVDLSSLKEEGGFEKAKRREKIYPSL